MRPGNGQRRRRNVATLVNLPSVSRPKIRTLSPDEARLLLKAAKGERLEALYTVTLALGFRRGEILGLSWTDVDLEQSKVPVNCSLQRVNGELKLQEPKTEQSRRTVAPHPAMVGALRAHRVRQQRERLLAGIRWQESGLVFNCRVGTPLEPRNMLRDFRRIVDKAGLPRMRFHGLRHSAASLLIAQGVHPRAIMELSGA